MKNTITYDQPLKRDVSITYNHSLKTDLAALFLRLIFGGIFIYHGYTKLIAYDDTLSRFPDLIGIGSQLSLNLVIFAEFVCGIFVVLGFLTRLAVIPIIITMAVAFFIAHADDAFGAKETPFVYLLLSIVVLILGSGKFSLDALLFRKRFRRINLHDEKKVSWTA